MSSLDLIGVAIVYCRVYVNKQSAEAHRRIFHAINEVVFADTGMYLEWRHIHSPSLASRVGILHWVGDQHQGQAKGLGLFLMDIVQRLEPRLDLHEERLLSSLSAYEHLHRLFQLCVIHVLQNIEKAPVINAVKKAMRSLICLKHEDWDGTL